MERLDRREADRWLVLGDGSDGYRLAHTQHHRDEFGEKEPDFLLYARYPISKASLRRKLVRDTVGISGYKNLKPAFKGLFRTGRRIRAMRYLSGQLFVSTVFALLGQPLFYLFFWLLPWGTYFPCLQPVAGARRARRHDPLE